MSEIILNGLVPNEFDSVIRVVDGEKWAKAEERTAELIACIQPNKLSEDRRGVVADYVQRLIMKCFPCQVFTFGSVPLKTYLPDGDIDVTAFSKNHNLKDTWAIQVRDILESEEVNENAEFCVKEVQYIQADVKIVKCLVENIVVDISFNQLGGLCTLCFLEEVDNLINQDHLFKRSIILIKAWCYYESRILGAHHGLISTYALEALVLYIFHVFNNSFAGPLEVLYRFLEFFSNFDWENFCVCLWGPVPIGSLPDINVEPPRKDGGELLLNKAFLQACNSVYAVLPGGLEDRGHPFISKHFNIIDPLRINNNLGRSVNKGNFYRIRSAFAFGAKKLGRLLDCPKENIAFELNRFFINTWERHGSGIRPDAQIGVLGCLRPLIPNSGSDSCSKPSHSKDCSDSTSMCVIGVGSIPTTRPLCSQRASYPLESTSVSNCNDADGTSNSSRRLDWCDKGISKLTMKADRCHRTLKHDQSVNQLKGKRLFTRTRSSPELTDAYYRDATRLTRSKLVENKTRNRPNAPDDSTSISNSHIEDSSTVMVSQDCTSVVGAQGMHQEEQDLINMMASSSLHNFGGHIRMPLNWAPPNLPPSISQPMLASMGYAQRSMAGMLPANIPFIDPHWAANFQFHQGLTSSSLPQYFPGERVANVEYWNERDVASNGELGVDEGTSDILHADDRQASSSGSSNEIDESVTVSQPSPALHVGRHQLSEFEESETSGSNSVTPIPPMVLDPGSHQRGPDGSGTRPFTFYPTGPPVPFFTMLPVYNYPAEANSSEPSSSPLVGEEGPGNRDSGQNSETTDQHDALNVFNASNHMRKSSIGELPEEPKRDILNSDFASHWENLQFGRFCQVPQYPAQIVYPPPVAVPPMYLQGHSPWDGPGRPVSANENLLSQRLSHAHPCEPTAVYQKFADEVPRYRNGTGTYLPSPKASTRGRQSSGGRRNNYSYDRNDHSDREGNWNVAKSRRSHNRCHTEKSRADRFTFNENRADTSWGSHRHQPLHHQPHNGPLRPISSTDASCGAHPFPGVNLVGVTSNGPTMPSVMLYPNDNNPGYVPVSPGEQPELGSLGPSDASQSPDSIQLRGACEDQIYHRSSTQHSSPDQPLSPHF